MTSAPQPSGTTSGAAGGRPTIPPGRIWLLFLLLLLANYVIANLALPGPDSPAPDYYSVFRAELAADNVEATPDDQLKEARSLQPKP